MGNIVILVDCVPEDPKVIYVGQEVYDAESTVLSFTYVSYYIIAEHLKPVVWKHEEKVFQLCGTICIENAILLICFDTIK